MFIFIFLFFKSNGKAVKLHSKTNQKKLKMEACPVCALDELLYPLDCTHKLCLKCIKGVCLHTGACPCCRAELSSAYKTRIAATPVAIRDVGPDIDTRIGELLLQAADGNGSGSGNVWAYNDRHNRGCWLYDETTQQEIKVASAAGLTGLDVTACGCVVRVDLEGCTQVNPTTRARRRIRKIYTDTPTIKGIAGMPRTSRTRVTRPTQQTDAVAAAGAPRRLLAESLASHRSRVQVAFHAAGNEPRRADEGKVQFNRRVKAWATSIF